MSQVIPRHGCDYYKYADDTEISDSAPPSDFTSAQANLQTCMSDTLSWIESNRLKVNTEKNRDDFYLLVCVSLVGGKSADIGGSSIPFQRLLHTLECILTKHCQ